MRVLVTGDWHLGVTQYGVMDENGINSRISDVEGVLNRVIDKAAEMNVDLFVVAGDIFHTNRPTPEEQRVFWRVLQRLQSQRLKARFIIGNHDYNAKLGASHALKLFQDIINSDQIKIIDETEWERFGDELLVCWYPYRGQAPDWADMALHRPVGATAVVCHSHLEGAVVGAEPFEIKDDRVTRFSELPVDFVWSGHFHKPQILCDRPLAFYPGSIQCVDFNERHDIKGVVIVETGTREYTTVGFDVRRFVQIDLKDRADLREGDLSDVQDAIVKIVVTLPESRTAEFDEAAIRERVISAGCHNVATVNLIVERQKMVRDDAIRLDNGLRDNFKKFFNNKDYGDINDEVHAVGLEVIEQCES